MKKKIFQVFVLGILISLNSCAGLLLNAVKEAPVANKVLLHDNPKKGDYSLYQIVYDTGDPQANALRGNTKFKIEITDVVGGELHISEAFTGSGIAGGYLNGLVFKFVTDMEGNVKSAVLDDHGVETKLKIAQKGDEAYNNYQILSEEDFERWNVPSKVKVTAGEFETKARYLTKTKDMNSASYAVYLTNEDVKFQHVASYAVIRNDDGSYQCKLSAELIETGTK